MESKIKKLVIVLGVLGASFSAVFVRASSAPSMVLVLYRVFLASLMLSPVALWKHQAEWKSIPKKMYVLSWVSGMFLGLHFSAYFEALQYTSIASAVLLSDVEVFFVGFAMFFLFKEKIPLKGWLGICTTFLGSLIIAIADAGSGSNILIGDFLALSSAAAMAVYTLLGRACRQKMTTTVYTFLVYTSAMFTVLTLSLLRGIPLFGYNPKNFWLALGLAVCCTLLGHSVFSWGLKYEKASFIATAKMLDPVFASLLGIMIFQEIPQALVIAGGCVVICGVYYFTAHSE